jgi:hypothetical protein
MPLLIVTHNPAAADFLVVTAVLIIAVLAVFVLAAWLVIARGQARRDEREFMDSAADPALRSLRRKRLVLRSSRRGASRGEAVTAQLEPAEPPAPRRRTPG